MKWLFKITKHLIVKNFILGLITILLGTLLKFIVIPNILGLFNVTLTEIMGYIVASFIALIVRLCIKDLVEQLVDILMPYIFMNANSLHSSGSESGDEKPLDKGKGIGTSIGSDSEKEDPLDKGKAKTTNNTSDSEESLNKNNKKILVFTTANDLLNQHRMLSDRIHELMSINNRSKEQELELISLLEIAKNDTNITNKSNSSSASYNFSRSVSPSNHSNGSNDGFPSYNPKDYESDSGKGESSNKNK